MFGRFFVFSFKKKFCVKCCFFLASLSNGFVSAPGNVFDFLGEVKKEAGKVELFGWRALSCWGSFLEESCLNWRICARTLDVFFRCFQLSLMYTGGAE